MIAPPVFAAAQLFNSARNVARNIRFVYAHSLLPKRLTQMKSNLVFFIEQSPSPPRT